MINRIKCGVQKLLSAGQRVFHYRRPDLEQRLPPLSRWFDSEPGAKILRAQRKMIDQSISHCFGYHLLQISVSPNCCLFSDCRVQRQYRYHLLGDNIAPQKSLVLGDYEQLPFENDSLDVILLHHIPEFCDNPHQLLREVYRVLAPYGHIIMVGFNPWSPRWVVSRISRLLPSSPWHNRLISRTKMTDWLSILGFDIGHSHYGYSTTEAVNSHCAQLLKRIPLGSFYVIAARKQQATLTRIKPRWTVHNHRYSGLSPIKSRRLHDAPRRKNAAGKVA